MVGMPHRPDALEGALLVLRLIESKEKEIGKGITRFRVSETTLKLLWGRSRISLDYLHEVVEWLLTKDWALFFAGSTYAMIKVTAVEGWNRLASKRIKTELDEVARGEFDFTKLRHLLMPGEEGKSEFDALADEVGYLTADEADEARKNK